MSKRVQFCERTASAMAEYLSTLTKNNIEYRVYELVGGWEVEITGY